MVRGPGVITGRYGAIGQVYYVEEDFWPLNTTPYVRDFKGNDPKFISYFLKAVDFLAYSDKAAVPGVNRNHLHEAHVKIPGISAQNKIAEFLGTIDDRIALLRETNATLEAIAQALFKSWFVDFDPVHAKQQGRMPEGMDEATAALFPDCFEESELGLVPNGWKIGLLDNWLSVLETGRRPKGGVSGIENGVPSIGAESIIRVGEFDFSKTKYVSDEFFSKMKSGRLESRDVLLYKDVEVTH